jgi:Na+/H+ antiporter NhaD/arsenite permease-like protein
VAINGNIQNPFIVFFSYLLLPTMVNLFLTFVLLRFLFKKDLKNFVSEFSEEPIRDSKLALISKISLILLFTLVIIKIIFVLWGFQIDFRLTYIALVPAALIVVFSRRRVELIRKVDWRTLVFFVAMFVLMQSVWESGFFQSVIAGLNLNVSSVATILLVSVLLSQVISNVPLVALYLPLLVTLGVGTTEVMALVAGSTIAGNLFILGAASNVIIIQNAESKFKETLSFLEFAKVGVILTVINLIVYWLFLTVIQLIT